MRFCGCREQRGHFIRACADAAAHIGSGSINIGGGIGQATILYLECSYQNAGRRVDIADRHARAGLCRFDDARPCAHRGVYQARNDKQRQRLPPDIRALLPVATVINNDYRELDVSAVASRLDCSAVLALATRIASAAPLPRSDVALPVSAAQRIISTRRAVGIDMLYDATLLLTLPAALWTPAAHLGVNTSLPLNMRALCFRVAALAAMIDGAPFDAPPAFMTVHDISLRLSRAAARLPPS